MARASYGIFATVMDDLHLCILFDLFSPSEEHINAFQLSLQQAICCATYVKLSHTLEIQEY